MRSFENESKTVTSDNRDDPLWYKDAVIYQLHVKSFFDSNDDGVGDFPGLLAKLDYIAELGVDTIWLLPFYPSPRRDDGYDIAEYRGVHPDYGTMTDAKRFIAAAHARGMRVITELVINHTSDQHPWFQRARKAAPGSAARNFYVWSDSNQKYEGTRIIFCDTEKSNWTWDPVANAYFWHRFYSHQPDLNFDNPQVLKAVLSVMRFWLEAGVDGLRLDAIPYLVEREGTNNENLPETHVVLKKIRTHLEETFTNRMLLAEANQWPEDTQEYFGNGDECHMSFHFPLMPRMYMAIAKEDRFPIIDIMRQTPDIPENCQWAIFLRNHDELTLEMVTSSERDYLWETYAADRRARINLGIRRRLAPLLERDRRRIELMKSLLFSMPGTPVLYYGDEIGMGDNIHLGDRDGVRTPMQWSSDRNGGFSRADPERLVLPAIQSALYGYEAVNVETQRRDPHSLLNWTRRMLALRRQYKAFGRGQLRFLFPGNRKILAYLRQYESDTILCVANLSRTPQAVELDLHEFAGLVPVEMMGGTSFPAIGQLTYLLTLPPYGFYWFLLSSSAQPPSWHASTPEQMPEFVTLVLHSRSSEGLTPPSREIVRREVLPDYLQRRRWFSAKGEKIQDVNFPYIMPLPETDNLFLVELDVQTDQSRSRYVLPIGLLWDQEMLPPLPQQLALARIRRGPRVGVLTDAFALPEFARIVLREMSRGSVLSCAEGEIHFRAEPGLMQAGLTPESEIRWLGAEQTNSSLLIGSAAVLKLVRKVAPGVHPETEMTRHLTRIGYANTAPLLGEVLRIGPDGVPNTFIVLQGYLSNQGDGWAWTLDYLERTVEEAALTDESNADYQDDLLGYTAFAANVGKRLAELHAALAMPSDDPAFAPQPSDNKDAQEWVVAAHDQIERALRALRQAVDRNQLDDTNKARANSLLEQQDALLDLPRQLAAQGVGSLRTRIHGDFHLGQLLVSQGDAYLIDFEGEPAKPLEERRAKMSPMRDVAGLVRSFDYAVGAMLDPAREGGLQVVPTIQEKRQGLLEAFRTSAEVAFLDAYRQAAYSAEHQWITPQAEAALLNLFTLEKAAYEICYEAANRPTWLPIPLRGFAEIANRMMHGDQNLPGDSLNG